MANKKGKKKKEKIVYVDDGSTISDMSEVGGVGRRIKRSDDKKAVRSGSTFKEKFETFFNAMKTMFFPMLKVLIAISAGFLVMLLISLAANG